MQADDDTTRPVQIIEPGTQVAQYRVISKLGSGGMGVVYLAEDTRLRRQVALKFLSEEYSSVRTFRERFLREARSAAQLNHPNIVTIYEVAEVDQRVFIAMEHIKGKSLRRLIAEGQLSIGARLELLSQICKGLAVAHRAGIVHRDVKPSNILVDDAQRVRLLDFGLAKKTNDSELTVTGTIQGTVNYMSPEQSRGEEVDHRSDIFSAGVVAYELLTGQPPFKGDSVPATLYAIVHNQPEPLPSDLEDRLPGVPQLVERALKKNPDDRYQNVEQMAGEIDKILGLSDTSIVVNGSAAVSATPVILAVLYLHNLGTVDDDFLCYGVTEDLIIDLTRVSSIRVVPLHAVLKFKDRGSDLVSVAEQLKADLVLDGSIHRSESTIRVSAHLFDVRNGQTLWADRWEQALATLPEIKKKLAEGISQALDIGQTVIRQARLDGTDATGASAYENYLRAKYSFEHKRDRSDVDSALGLYQQALKEEPTLLSARTGIIEILMHRGDYDTAESELKAALKEAVERELRTEEGDILHQYARYYLQRSDLTASQEMAHRAMQLKRELDDPAGEAEVLSVLISLSQTRGDFDQVIGLFDRVLEIARQLDDRDKTAEAFKNMGIAYARKGEYEQALQLYTQALEIARECGNESLQAACLANMGNIEFFRSNLDSAYDNYNRAYEKAIRLGDSPVASKCTLNKALVELRRLRFRKGLALLEEAGQTFKQMGNDSMYAAALVNQSQALLTLGQLDKARQAAEQGHALAVKLDQPLTISDALLRLAAVDLYAGISGEAKTRFTEAWNVAHKAGISRNVAQAEVGMAEFCMVQGEYEQAVEFASKSIATAREIGEQSIALKASLIRTACSIPKGLVNIGIDRLRRLAKDANTYGDRELKMFAETLLGKALLEHGNLDTEHDEGRSTLETTLAEAQEYELVPLIKLIEQMLLP